MNMRLRIPADVVRAVAARWPDNAAEWGTSAERELSTICTRYRATPRTVMPARYGFVVASDTPTGPLIMRASPDPAGPQQAMVSQALASLGIAPKVHEVVSTTRGTWVIMDRVRPGYRLTDCRPGPDVSAAVAAMLRPMVGQPAPCPMPSLADWLQARLEDDELADLAPNRSIAPLHQRRNASAVLKDLRAGGNDGLCHGDASSGNILVGGNGLILIDPRGMSGEVEYDAAVAALKIARQARPTDIAERLSRQIGIDTERTKAWVAVADAARV
ncbi:phosphotransferase [Actinoallomurus sp. CA-142502]|uniref:phosphotransferase n=1 Tax=Actinoallomurus sp. CA-142502 TaxID=3239885 RepID=UPI003D9252D5